MFLLAKKLSALSKNNVVPARSNTCQSICSRTRYSGLHERKISDELGKGGHQAVDLGAVHSDDGPWDQEAGDHGGQLVDKVPESILGKHRIVPAPKALRTRR